MIDSLCRYHYHSVTDHLLLRTFTVNDIHPGYLSALSDQSVVGMTGASTHQWSEADVEKYVTNCFNSDDSLLIGAYALGSKAHVGNIRLHHYSVAHSRISIGIMLHDCASWGKGYGTAMLQNVTSFAFQTLNLHKVYADYYACNLASQKMFEKAGYLKEGLLKKHFLYNGEFVDAICVAQFNEVHSK